MIRPFRSFLAIFVFSVLGLVATSAEDVKDRPDDEGSHAGEIQAVDSFDYEDDDGPWRTSMRSAGATWHVGAYEAEFAALGGGAHTVGSADGSDREIGDLGGEASGRQAVTLTNADDSMSFTTLPADEGANAIVFRYSIPDAPSGGGQPATLDLSITDRSGASVLHATLKLNSRYAWLYGGIMDGVNLYNVPVNAGKYGRPRQSSDQYTFMTRFSSSSMRSCMPAIP